MTFRVAPARLALRFFAFSCVLVGLSSCHGRTGHRASETPGSNHSPGSYIAPPGAKAFIEGAPSRSNAAQLSLRIYGPDLLAYRTKFGPVAATDCANAAGYSADTAAATPFTVDQAPLADGDYLLCVVGADHTRTWQADPTTAVWTLDRKGPSAFTINALEAQGANGAQKISWTAPAPDAAKSYEVALAGEASGCTAPATAARTEATDYTFTGGIPGGRFVVCVTAFDDLGNATPATNNGHETLESPAALHLAYFKGDGAEAKTLIHAVRALDGTWHQTAVAAPGGRYGSRAALQLNAKGQPVIAYQLIEQPDLSTPKLSLDVAVGGDNGSFSHRQLFAATVPGLAGQQASLAFTPDGEAHAVHLALDSDRSQLVYTRAATSDSSVSVKLAAAEDLNTTFQDTTLAADQKGRLHLAFVRGGKLFYQLQDGGNWKPEQALDTADCAAVTLATAGVSSTGQIYVAYLCSQQDGRTASCSLGLAAGTADSAATGWQHKLVAALDPANACLPFNSARPSLAVDAKGRAHVFYRYTDASHAGAWDVAYGLFSGTEAAGDALALGDWGAKTGFPLLTLDASDRIYALYMAGDAVKFAAADTGSALKADAVNFDGDAGISGGPLELADLVVQGGHGHGYQAGN